ncbi:hypothetical protein EDB81DRAFT_776565 [Dactylonectria macrodidyma]|uniref:Secreted protein n=1 Tax=Dactylonectria macrodidyma TaxID=307937 RepID=A0A9P9FQ57_9HYPO|nr:hypothetical protein EDB81DRAFT_776565 [Dactylonectria macrodidyma]
MWWGFSLPSLIWGFRGFFWVLYHSHNGASHPHLFNHLASTLEDKTVRVASRGNFCRAWPWGHFPRQMRCEWTDSAELGLTQLTRSSNDPGQRRGGQKTQVDRSMGERNRGSFDLRR